MNALMPKENREYIAGTFFKSEKIFVYDPSKCIRNMQDRDDGIYIRCRKTKVKIFQTG